MLHHRHNSKLRKDDMKNNPTAQEAANYFAETPQHQIQRHKIHIKSLKEVLSMTRESRDELKSINVDLLKALNHIIELIETLPKDMRRLDHELVLGITTAAIKNI